MKPLLIVAAGSTYPELASERGDFADWIARGMGVEEAEVTVCEVFRGARLPAPASLAGAVVTGSHAMVTDREPWSERTAAWLRDVVATQTPLLAICYGHQLLAHALGGRVDDHPRGREIGTVEIALTAAGREDPLIGTLPGRFTAHVTHGQSALALPPGTGSLAGNDFEPHHAFRAGPAAWGVQFHPEFDAAVMRAYVHGQVPALARRGLDPARVAGAVTETPESAALLRRFARLARRLTLPA